MIFYFYTNGLLGYDKINQFFDEKIGLKIVIKVEGNNDSFVVQFVDAA